MNRSAAAVASIVILVLAATALLLTSCAPEARIVTQRVEVEVPVPCKADVGERPKLLTKEEVKAALDKAPNFDERLKIVTVQLLLYIGWTPKVEAGLKGCTQLPSQ